MKLLTSEGKSVPRILVFIALCLLVLVPVVVLFVVNCALTGIVVVFHGIATFLERLTNAPHKWANENLNQDN